MSKTMQAGEQRAVKVAVFDFDNTLWDQVGGWEKLTNAWIAKVAKITGVPEATVFDAMSTNNRIYQVHEHPDQIRLNPALLAKYDGKVPREVMAELMQEYRAAEKEALVMFPGVKETLKALKDQGVKLVCFSEANAAILADRLKRLGLDKIFDVTYSEEGPNVARKDHFKQRIQKVDYGMACPQKVFVKRGPKANSEGYHVLMVDLIKTFGQIEVKDVAMIGDNPVRDVHSSQAAGYYGVYCKYGHRVTTPDSPYKKSVPIIFPTVPGGQAEVKPDAVLETGIADLTKVLKGPAQAPKPRSP